VHESLALHPLDWTVIGLYLVLALGVGIAVRRRAGRDRESYFLAGRSLPWWWAGLSIAATTFAADTPLAVTGIVATKGMSGNWIWVSWLGVHAAVIVYFAARWRRSGVLTDAELVDLRYSGREAGWLRLFRAGLYGVVYNCIILGWVLRAMVKIVSPFFRWQEWLPGLVSVLEEIWPRSSSLGSPSEGLTIIALLAIVATYSSLGGIRGVIFTDLIQLAIALAGSVWLAILAWDSTGGGTSLVGSLETLYGPDHGYLDLLPDASGGWLTGAGLGSFAFGVYLLVQSYANVPADGGGYLMQRLGTTREPSGARHASLLFVVVQYLVRTWPWLVVAVAALVLVPIGDETTALGGAASAVAGDREMAYPVLMAYLMPPVALGLMVTSLLAAFMSTVDTHINWGASYIVNDVLLRLRPRASNRLQVLVARLAVAGFALAAVLVSFGIDTIEQAWKWVAALGAALGVPTALRWFWWRVNAAGEIGAMVAGLGTALVLTVATDVGFEVRLVVISAASIAGLAAGMLLGPSTDPVVIERFAARVGPHGWWPGRRFDRALAEVAADGLRWCAVLAGTFAIMAGCHQFIFMRRTFLAFGLLLGGIPLLLWGAGVLPVGRRA
jgi:Na+/proline symporter